MPRARRLGKEHAGREHVGSPGCVHEQACAQPMECLAKDKRESVRNTHGELLLLRVCVGVKEERRPAGC